MVNRETWFREQFLDVLIRQPEPQVLADRANNDLGFEVPPFEQRRPRFVHGIYVQSVLATQAVDPQIRWGRTARFPDLPNGSANSLLRLNPSRNLAIASVMRGVSRQAASSNGMMGFGGRARNFPFRARAIAAHRLMGSPPPKTPRQPKKRGLIAFFGRIMRWTPSVGCVAKTQ